MVLLDSFLDAKCKISLSIEGLVSRFYALLNLNRGFVVLGFVSESDLLVNGQASSQLFIAKAS